MIHFISLNYLIPGIKGEKLNINFNYIFKIINYNCMEQYEIFTFNTTNDYSNNELESK